MYEQEKAEQKGTKAATENSAEDIIDLGKIPPDRIVFWTGAGMDNGAPTGLLLGHGLTDFVLQFSCKKLDE